MQPAGQSWVVVRSILLLVTWIMAFPSQAQDGAVSASVEDVERPSMGNPHAEVVIVQFTDYQCRYCRAFFEERLPVIKERFIDSGEARFVVRDFPLKRHEQSRPAAIAAACAGRQGKYWQMHEKLYQNQEVLTDVNMTIYARELELDMEVFAACQADPAIVEQIEADLAAARQARVTGTPAFLIGRMKDGWIEGTLIVGFFPSSVYAAEVSDYLDKTSD